MENIADVQNLLSRAENAEEPDRDLDADIWLVFTPGATRQKTTITSSTDAWPPYVIDETRQEDGRLITVASFTASIDQALELVRKHYPDAGVILESGYRGPYSCCTLRRQDGPAFTTGTILGQHSRPDDELALAIVSAFLMAKEAEGLNLNEVEDDARLAG